MKIFDLGSNSALSLEIARHLKIGLGKVTVKQFADSETHIQFHENLRGRQAFLIQSSNQPDRNFWTLKIGLDAVMRAGGRNPIAVMPYFGYARQERKSAPREPISARVKADELELAGARGVVTMDFHTNAIEGFFSNKVKVDQIYARPVFLNYFLEAFSEQISKDELVIGTPDAGGAARARSYAKHLSNRSGNKTIPLAVVDKRRDEHNKSVVNFILGDIENKDVILIDDIYDTCGTVIGAAQALMNRGARSVYTAATHGLFSNTALADIHNSVIKKVFVTNTIYNPQVIELSKDPHSKIKIISVGKIFADAIDNIHKDLSVSKLFN